MAGTDIIEIKGDNWKSEVLESKTPVLVDFWAEWCGPCRMLTPVLHDLATEMAGQLKIVKVNVDENRELAAQFNIRSIPSMLIFKAGAVQGQMVGAMNKAALKEKLTSYL
jgi:thioredoxin 1